MSYAPVINHCYQPYDYEMDLDEGWTPPSTSIRLPESDVRSPSHPDSKAQDPVAHHDGASRLPCSDVTPKSKTQVDRPELSYPTPPPTNRIGQKPLEVGAGVEELVDALPILRQEVPSHPLDGLPNWRQLKGPGVPGKLSPTAAQRCLSPLDNLPLSALPLEVGMRAPSPSVMAPPRVIREAPRPPTRPSPLEELAACAAMQPRLQVPMTYQAEAGPSVPTWGYAVIRDRDTCMLSTLLKAHEIVLEREAAAKKHSGAVKAKGTAKKAATKAPKASGSSTTKAKNAKSALDSEPKAKGVKRKRDADSTESAAKKAKTAPAAKVTKATRKPASKIQKGASVPPSVDPIPMAPVTVTVGPEPLASLAPSGSEDASSGVDPKKTCADISTDGAIQVLASDPYVLKTRTGRVFSFSGPSENEPPVVDVNPATVLAPIAEGMDVDTINDTIACRVAARKGRRKSIKLSL